MRTVGILGCGRLGEAVLGGMLDGGVVDAEDVLVTAGRPSRVDELVERHGVRGTTDNAAVARCDVVVLGLKPQVLPGVLEEVGGEVRSDALVVSLAAGIATDRLDGLLPTDPAIVRVMSNTPAFVRSAVSVVTPGPRVTDEQLDLVERLLVPLGQVRHMAESSIDAVTAVSGSGPAYVFLFAEALTEAAVLAGLTRDDAVALAVGTIEGAGALLAAGEASAAELREQVTSPGGTTAAALHALERGGVRAAVLDAVTAAVERARELG